MHQLDREMNQTKTVPTHKRSAASSSPSVATKRCTATIPSFDELPDSALVRQAQLVRDPKNPTRPAPLPFSPSTFWRKVAAGQFPKPLKLGERITAWRVGEVRAWIESQANSVQEVEQ